MRDMTERRVRHVPVMTERRLVGVISIGDILKSVCRERSGAAVLRDIGTPVADRGSVITALWWKLAEVGFAKAALSILRLVV